MARPREFDEDHVLDSALLIFWEKGYDGTSLSDLLSVTGLSKSSLYAAYGSKEGLFDQVVDRYHRDHLSFRLIALEQLTPRRIVEKLMLGMVNLQISAHTPRGCLEINAALGCSDENEKIHAVLAQKRTMVRVVLRERFEEFPSAAGLPAGMTADSAAFHITTLIYGMAVQARSGASCEELRRLVETALLSWPE